MKILVACEYSATVRDAFRKKGHDAWSCDILPCDGDPTYHYQCDVKELLKQKWDMIIAFPPCTYMSNAGACRMYPTKGIINPERLQKALRAKEFFMMFLNNDCEKIVIENPQPLKIVGLPKQSQVIQPYQFGEPYSKKTLLWLKGLPQLKSTNVLSLWKPFIASGTSINKGKTKGAKFANGSHNRSKTFQGIADAMADQWGSIEEKQSFEEQQLTLF